jgi:hypothetical protein
MTGCVGCYIAPNDELAGLRDGDTIAVDWHKTVVEERYDVANATACSIHPRYIYMLNNILQSNKQQVSLQYSNVTLRVCICCYVACE